MVKASRPVLTRPVLFLCDRNMVRSPMAAGLLGAGATSAGLDPGDWVEPFACAALLESGIDITAHTPAAVDFRGVKPGTLVIALTPATFAAAREVREKQGFDLEFWDLPAIPAHDTGREAILDGYRSIRDALAGHIRNRFGGKA